MSPVTLDAVGNLLEKHQFRVAIEPVLHPVDEQTDSDAMTITDVLLAEQPLLVVAVVVASRWSDIGNHVDGLVIAIADLVATRDPSPRQWDLTIPLFLNERLASEDQVRAAAWAADTHHARRFIAGDGADTSLSQALAPILPLELVTGPEDTEAPMEQLRRRLAQDLGDRLADTVVSGFERDGEVTLP